MKLIPKEDIIPFTEEEIEQRKVNAKQLNEQLKNLQQELSRYQKNIL